MSDTTPDLFLIHSGLEIIYANPTFCALLGAESQEQLIGTSLTDLVTSDCHSPLRDQVIRIENNDAPTLGLTIQFQTFTGQPQRAILMSSLAKWDGSEQIQTSVFPIAGADGESRHQLHDQVIDEAPMGITITDPDREDNPLIYVNDGFCELTGYPRDESLGQNCRFLQGEATREEPVAQMREAIDAEEPITIELRNYQKDDSMFWNRITITPIRSDSGTVTTWLGYQQDVTAEKRYEQDLSLFKEQAKEANRAILITNPEETIEYVNPAFERLTGYSASEAIGRTPRMLEPDQQDWGFDTEVLDQISADEVWEAEVTNQTKHGEIFELKRKIVPVTDKRGEITNFVWIEEDITEKVLTTQTLNILNRVLRHNLRNALNMIDGHAELLEDEELDPEARQASVTVVRDQAKSMKKVAEKTAKIRSLWNPSDTHGTWESLKIKPLVASYQQQYPDADIACIAEDDGDIQIRHTELFKQAMDEAVTNAIQHTDQLPPEVTITIQRDLDADQVQIRVADNGPGIPEDERQSIELGNQTPLNHSLGIGLWFMQWIMVALGGTLTITDNEPRGSVVTFQLPVGNSNDG